jgi:hypothetical protein
LNATSAGLRDYFATGATLTITLIVPEPGELALIIWAISSISMARRRSLGR